MPIVPGQNLGSYEVVEEIGRDGTVTVYKGYHAGLTRHVTIKVLPVFHPDGPSFRARFQREAKTVARLRHPNIPSVYDYGDQDDVTYLISEHLDGGTLVEHLGAPMPPEICAGILRPIASALDYAHSLGIVHRDVKPSSVLMTGDGRILLANFGIARIVGDVKGLSQGGLSVGTPEYMAPEQAMEDNVGPAADVYSLAVVAYQMLTGDVPYSGETPLAIILAHIHNPLPLPRDRNPDLPEAVQDVLVKGLAKQPEGRYQSAGEFVEALGQALAEDRNGPIAVAGGVIGTGPPGSAAASGVRHAAHEPGPKLRPVDLIVAACLGIVAMVVVAVLLLGARGQV